MNKETLTLLGSYLAIKGLLRNTKQERHHYQDLLAFTIEKDPEASSKISSYQIRIEEIDIEVKNYTNQLRSLDRTLAELKNQLDSPRFKVFYLHYVKGMSLQKAADKVGYSKAGAVKICRRIKSQIV